MTMGLLQSTATGCLTGCDLCHGLLESTHLDVARGENDNQVISNYSRMEPTSLRGGWIVSMTYLGYGKARKVQSLAGNVTFLCACKEVPPARCRTTSACC